MKALFNNALNMSLRSFSLAALAAVVLLTGCSALNLKRPVSEEDLARTKNVGVVSLLGDKFFGISIGTTVFNNEYFEAVVPEWGVEHEAAKMTVELLASNPSLRVALVAREGVSSADFSENSGKALWEAATKQGFDKLVIVRPGVSDNYPFYKPGVGLFARSFFGLANSCVYAAYVVDVYDVATQKPVAWEWGGEAPCQPGSEKVPAFKKPFSDYSEQEKQELRSKVIGRLAKTLPYALNKLALISSKP